jgi:uroporphyrinogen-III synthase
MVTKSPNATDLHGLRVMITRPQAQVPAWRACLTSAGADTVVASLMAIVPISDKADSQAVRQRVMALDTYQHVIFVSQNAAHYGLQWIDDCWSKLPSEINVYAVGSATAQQLHNHDVHVIEAGHTMNTEALLALPQLQNVGGDKVLIFRGQGGRPVLAEQLQERGAEVDYGELYQRQFPPQASQQVAKLHWGQPGDVVALHSGEALDNWCQIMTSLASTSAWQAMPTLVPGKRVADKARNLGFECVIEASNASDQQMLAALQAWHTSSKN